ncbi:LamG-like jellyroll fold domain-containing protein [Geminocystis sp. NIES-3709]|uniref:LamG-like jellyroll fold domain-containing protein n=1 Tax=Geminocystis sp. NIES-3709 TaxID=1617448 RepID=UPI0005FC63A6|nr:LamG-like jellyroll fold domain-containing protein [Geminocystis sp. NIES-3709]BAQ64272.1 alkaline phosphatase [Geminocystis sp. NIES-3709]
MTDNNELNFVFPSNNALRLDGVDDRVALRNANQLGLNGDFTVEAWVNINEFPSGQVDHPILGTDQRETNQGLHLTIRNQRPYMGFFNNDLQGNTVLQPKTWYHITYRYTASTRQQAIFVNGQLDSTRTATANFQGTGLVNIGRWSNDRYFNGSIDELRIWNRPLTQTEIQENRYTSLEGNENSLRAYYTFNDTTNNILDRTNNGNNGTLIDNRNFVLSINESFGNAVSFNGIDGFVQTVNHTNPTNAITISLYAKSNTPNWNSDGFLASKRDAYILHPIVGSKQIQFFILGLQPVSFTPSSDFDLTQWHSYTGTFDGNTIRLYIDGNLVASRNERGTIRQDNGPLFIGRDDGLNRFFNGSIDEVTIWNRALSESEIQNTIIGKPLTGTEANLVGYYNFDYNGIVDKTNNNNNASLFNGADVQLINNEPSSPFGNVLALDGIDDRVALTNANQLGLNGDFTVEARVYVNEFSTARPDQSILGTDQSSTNQGLHLIIRNQRPHMGFFANDLTGNSVLQAKTWYHITYRYTANNREQAIFVNGQLDSTRTATANFQGTGLVNIGRWLNDRYLNGNIDELRIWNKPLTQEEIQANLNNTLTGNESGLTGYYNFDSINYSNPNVITDLSPNQNNGTLNNGNQNSLNNFLPAQIQPSENVLVLDGVNDYLEISNSNAVNFTTNQNFTVETLVKANPNQQDLRNNDNDIIEKWSGDSGYPFVIRYIRSTGRISVARFDGSNNPGITSNSSINDGKYHHIAFVKEGTQLRLYIDGRLEGSTTDTTRNSTTNNSPLFIGRRGGNTPNHFRGEIDEVRIWNKVLTQQELQANLNNTLTGNESSLTAYYDFEETTITANNNTVIDRSVNNNTGTLNAPVNDIRPLEESFPESFVSLTISDFIPIINEENDNPNDDPNFIGYVEVKLSQSVTDLPGLLINYAVTGTATLGEDFYISQTNLSTTDNNPPTNSLFIPQGADSGKIYISALPDAIAENTETITVSLLPQTEFGRFGGGFGNNLFVTGTTQVTINLQDSGNYTAGIAIADGFRQEVTENNLIVANEQGVGVFKVKLTSQPTADVTVTFNSSQGSLSTSTLTFNANNWDNYQYVTIGNITDRFNINASVSSDDSNYTGRSQLIGVTNNSEDVKIGITEGGEIQPIPLPMVSIFTLKDAVEGENDPGIALIQLNQSAPMGGITVNYSFAPNSATLGTDFAVSEIGQVTIPEGELSARVIITPTDDQKVNSNRGVTLTLVESTENYTIDTDNQNATIDLVDNDTADLRIVEFINTSAIGISNDDALLLNIAVKQPTVQQETFDLTDTGAIALIAIALTQQPIANVTVTIKDVNNPSTTNTLTFTPENWDIVQELEIEMLSALDGTLKLEALTASSDNNYNDKIITLPFLQDTKTVDRLVISEDGDKVVFGVALTSQPDNDVNLELDFNLNIVERESGQGLAEEVITFNSDNWNNYQKVVIKGVDNEVYNPEEVITPIRFVSDSQDGNYNNQMTDLVVVNQDNENQEVETTPVVNDSEFIISLNVINRTLQETADSFAEIEFNLNKPAPEGGLLVEYELNSGSAIAGEDFLSTFQLRTGENNPLSVIPSNLQMIAPTFADLNNDGILELIVGHSNGLLYYENQGTSDNPNYVLNSDNALSALINGRGFRDLNPTFVDINGDGDLDLFIGSNQNNILFYENRGTASEPNFLQRSGTGNPLNNLTIPSFSNLTFGDIDRDGDSDLLVGTANGNLRYFENIGSVTAPSFTEVTANNNPFQSINEEFALNNITDVTPTLVDFNNNGNLHLFIGDRQGNLFHYINIGTLGEPNFILETGSSSPFFDRNMPSGFAKPTITDINNDGNVDVVIGQINGEVRFYENTGIGKIFIPEGETSATIQVKTIPDLIAEDNETIEVRLVETAEQNYRLTGNFLVTSDFDGETIGLKLNETTLDSLVLKAGSELIFDGGAIALIAENVTITNENTLVNLTLSEKTEVTTIITGETTYNPIATLVKIIDNDVAGLKISTDEAQTNLVGTDNLFAIRENNPNTAQTFYISLNSKPIAPVEVYFGSSDTTQGLVNGENFNRLVFTENNWNTPQSFTVTPVDNNINEGDTEYQILSTLVSEDLKYNDNVVNLDVTTPYDEANNTIGFQITNENISSSILKKGTRLVFDNKAEAIVTEDVELSRSQTTLVNLEQVIGQPTGNTAFKQRMGNPININDLDDDQADIILIPPSNVISEGFANNYYSIQLATQPLGEVFIRMTPDSNDIELDNKFAGESLTIVFDENNWNIPRLVSVTAVDDFEVEYQQAVNLDFAVTSETDTAYTSLTPPQVQVIVEDNDLPVATVQTVAAAIEGESPGYFVISLDKPASDFFGKTGMVINYTVSGTARTDNSINADIQPLTGIARIAPGKIHSNLIAFPIDDFLVEEGETVTVTLELGNGYVIDETAPSQSTLAISDNDEVGIRIVEMGNQTQVVEGETTEILISLLSQPEAPVTINLTPETTTANLIATSNYSSSTRMIDLRLDSDNINSLLLSAGTVLTFEGVTATVTQDVLLSEDRATQVSLTLTSGNSIVSGQLSSYTYQEYEYVGANEDGTLTLTFDSNNWYQLQTVAITALDDNVAEKGQFHTLPINYIVTSDDPNYDKFEVASTNLNIIDRVFDKQNTIDGVSQGLLTLQDSLDNLTVPILGSLEGKAPQFIDIFARSLANELRNSPVITFDVLNSALNTSLEEALAQDNGINDDTTEITVQITDLSTENVSFQVGIKADYNVFSVPLGADLGLSGLGIGIQTQGNLESNFSYDFNLGFGVSETEGFYINTEDTSFTVNADLGLSEDFTAVGNLGFLRLDFANGSSDSEIGSTGIDTEFVVTLTNPTDEEDTRLTTSELTANRGANSIFDFIEYGFRGDAALNFDVATSIQGNTAFPSFSFNLASELPLFNYSNQAQANDTESPMLTVTQGLVTIPNNRMITGTPFTLTVVSDNENSDTRLTKGTELVFQGSENDTPTTVVLDRTVILSPNNPQEISVVIPIEGVITSVDVDIQEDETATLESSGFNLSFNEITLDLGSFITNIVSPVIRFTNQIIDPFRPVINALTTNVQFLSAIGLAGQFDRNGDNQASLIEVASALSANSSNLRYTEFFDAVANIIEVINALDQLNRDIAGGANITIPFGDYTLENFTGASQTNTSEQVDVENEGTNNLNDNVEDEASNPDTDNDRLGNSISNFFTKLNRMGVELPILENPLNAIKLFLGQDIDLVTYNVPDLNLNFNIRRDFPIFGPVSGVLEGSFSAQTDLDVGFDTNGFSQWRNRDFNLRDSYLTLDGFYLNDLDSRGFDKNELTLNATIGAGASLNAILATASVTGGIRGNAYLDLIDVGEYNGTGDGRIRTTEVISRITNPTSLFELSGGIDAFLRAIVQVGINLGFIRINRTVFDRDLATVNLFRFSVGGNRRGTVGQSYMQGTKVFWDANFDGMHNEDEPFAYTDDTGFYDLNVPLTVFDLDRNGTLDNSEGRYVAVGGMDTSSRLTYVSPFYATADSSMITPLTTLKARLMDLEMSAEVAEGYIKDSLTLGEEVDINTFDPILAMELGDRNGLDVYGSHIKIKSILEFTNSLTGAFSQTADMGLNEGELFEFVTALTNDIVMNQDTPDIWENVEVLISKYGATLAQFFLDAEANSTIAEDDIPTVMEVWANAVALASGLIASSLEEIEDVTTAVESLMPVKMKLQDKLVTLMENMGNGTVSPNDSLIALERLFSEDPKSLLTDTLTRFQKTEPFGIYLLTGEEESRSIRENYPVFEEEEEAFSVSFAPDDQLIRINRFQHESGGYLYAGEEESDSIRENYPDFVEEGIAFYALDANANQGVDIYRFRNNEVTGSYLFVGEEEKDSILANYPQYVLEGVAFEVVI